MQTWLSGAAQVTNRVWPSAATARPVTDAGIRVEPVTRRAAGSSHNTRRPATHPTKSVRPSGVAASVEGASHAASAATMGAAPQENSNAANSPARWAVERKLPEGLIISQGHF